MTWLGMGPVITTVETHVPACWKYAFQSLARPLRRQLSLCGIEHEADSLQSINNIAKEPEAYRNEDE